jgi:hypothetical protein
MEVRLVLFDFFINDFKKNWANISQPKRSFWSNDVGVKIKTYEAITYHLKQLQGLSNFYGKILY